MQILQPSSMGHLLSLPTSLSGGHDFPSGMIIPWLRRHWWQRWKCSQMKCCFNPPKPPNTPSLCPPRPHSSPPTLCPTIKAFSFPTPLTFLSRDLSCWGGGGFISKKGWQIEAFAGVTLSVMAESRLFSVYWTLIRDRMAARDSEIGIVRTK